MKYSDLYPQDKSGIDQAKIDLNLTDPQMTGLINNAVGGKMDDKTKAFWQNYADKYGGLPSGFKKYVDPSFLSGKASVTTMNKFDPIAGDKAIVADLASKGIVPHNVQAEIVRRLYAKGDIQKIKELTDAAANITPEAQIAAGNVGILPQALQAVNQGVEKVTESAPYKAITYIPKKVVGGVVGAVGGLIGGQVGAYGQIAKNLYQGQPITKDVLTSAIDVVKKTSGFGFDVGEAGVAAAPLAALGGVPGAVIGSAQVYKGAQDLVKAHESGNPEQWTQALTTIVGGTLALHGGIKGLSTAYETGSAKGLMMNPEAPSPKELYTGAKETLGAAKEYIKPSAPKTPEALTAKVLSTPEGKISKLSTQERNIYYNNKLEQAKNLSQTEQQALQQKYSEMETGIQQQQATIKTETATKIAEQQIKNAELENALVGKTVEEAYAQQPKLRKALIDNSKTYQILRDKVLEPVKNNIVNHNDIIDYIKSKYDLNSPDQAFAAQAEMTRLNLQENGKSTIGSLYENLKSVRQEISSGAKKGTKVFSADDMKTQDAVASLSQYLETQGVNLSEANAFWRKWAPVRDNLVAKIQPFTPAGIETGQFKSFTNLIKSTVESPDPRNAAFIKVVEEATGEKIGNTATREAYTNLTQGQKNEIALKLEQDTKLAELNKQADEAKLKLDKAIEENKGKLEASQKQIESEKIYNNFIAARRLRIKVIIGSILSLTGLAGTIGGKVVNEIKKLAP